MNKYEFRDKIFELQQCPIDIKYRVKLATELLNEYEPLKERATPKKVVRYFKNEKLFECPTCQVTQEKYFNDIYEKEYCCNCGKALDFGDSNE